MKKDSPVSNQARRILVTGSSGHIGAAVAERMSRNFEVLGLDVVPGPWTTAVADISDHRAVDRLMPGIRAVIHSAALHAPHVRDRSEGDFRRINVDGTRILLDAAMRHGVRRFVLTSTTSVYGCTSRPKNGAVWVNEDLEPHPEDIYDFTKLEAERLCRDASRNGLEAVALRMSRCFPEPAPLIVFYRLYRGCDRRDAAEGHWLAAVKPIRAFEIINLSADPVFIPEDTDELWNDPWKAIDRRAPGLREEFLRRTWELPRRIDRVYTIEKAKRILGYQPCYGFREALEEA